MNRRNFLAGTGIAALGAASGLFANAPSGAIKLSMNEATSMNRPYQEFIEGVAKAGFRYVEPWVHKIDEFVAKDSLAAAKRVIGDNGLTTCCACAQGEIVEPLPDADQAKAFDQLKHKIEVCAALGIPRLNVHSLGKDRYKPSDYDGAAERWVKACDMAQQAGVRLVLEFIRATTFMSALPTALQILRKANHPNAGMTLDLWHLWGGPSKFEDLEMLRPGEPEHVHINDAPGTVPREVLNDGMRMPPGRGSIPAVKIFRALLANKYDGFFSVELFDPKYQNAECYPTAVEMKRATEALFARV